VLIGDEGSSCYLEGFNIDFNATKPCFTNDLTMNTLLYDLANDVIIDKTGRGVADIRAHELRLSLAAGESFQAWSKACITPGGEELRYLKFFLRAEAKGEPYTYDTKECAFVVASLRHALHANADALGSFWLGYTLKATLADEHGIAQLRAWVTKHGGPAWWTEQWQPLMCKCAASKALVGSVESDGPPAPSNSAPRKLLSRGTTHRRTMRWPPLLLASCLRSSSAVEPAPS